MSSYTYFALQEQVGTGRWVDVREFPELAKALTAMERLSGTWSLRVVRRAERVVAAELEVTQ